ncbi:MAG: noncanonical pyrimidine nucleotidase, YjjG family [Bacteroidetes bacterium]|nr:noncanonical pyrimidine nucleotidase, YjjG family [Bacteroidota bacterium]
MVPSFDDFFSLYKKINYRMWDEYEKGIISKEQIRFERFKQTFDYFSKLHALDIEAIASYYTAHCPQKGALMDGAVEILEYLNGKGYQLHLITNGFKEVQFIKINGCNIGGYFKEIIISEMVGVMKPDKRIFDYALSAAKGASRESIMIGDSLYADIGGAMNAGLKAIYFNPEKNEHTATPTYEIFHLLQLKQYF